MGWVLWDSWIWKEHEEKMSKTQVTVDEAGGDDGSSSAGSTMSLAISSLVNRSAAAAAAPAGQKEKEREKENQQQHLSISSSTTTSGVTSSEQPAAAADRSSLMRRRSGDSYPVTLESNASASQALAATTTTTTASASGGSGRWPYTLPHVKRSGGWLSFRNRQRLTTLKSALMIYFSLLGLSPILKSLTKSTASDSIWAVSCWLLIMNIFSFDYGSGEGAGATKFPASLSTNAAVMASTVLASRLPSTTHVFSLMLFSIEVFGLFPIFRRQLRHTSWTGHAVLTLILVITAGAAVGLTFKGGWTAAIVGAFLGSILTALAMGGCSWWLISLQKYKNVVTGPWDPARPILRRHWD